MASKLTVLLPKDEAERFSAYCETLGYKKSTLIARLIRDHLDEEGFRVGAEGAEPRSKGSARKAKRS